MKPSLFGKIQSQWDNIVHSLDVKRVCDVLMAKFTLLPNELQRINSQVTDDDQARQLLEILRVKDDQHFENFLAALDRTDHKYIADAIRNAKVPSEYVEPVANSGATASTSSSNSTRIPNNGPVNTISSLRPSQKGDTWKYNMAGEDILTEAKKKHNYLCNRLDGVITKDSFQSMKRMAMTYLDPKQVEKANNMNELLHQLEVKGVLAVGEYDTLIELMNLAGIGIGIDDIRKTNTEIQIIMQSRIHTQGMVALSSAEESFHAS